MTKTTGRHSPAIRLAEVRAILNTGEGESVYGLADRLGVSVKSARRYIVAIERSGDPIYEDWEGKRKVYRLMPTARRDAVQLTTSQMLSLFLSRRVFDFLEGTGFKEDLDDVFRQLELTLKRQDTTIARNLDRKIYDVNEAPHLYEGRIEDVNDVLTALIREERLQVTHVSTVSKSGRRKRFVVEPYTLLVYKKGLYLVGYSHRHEEIRTFALDGFREVEWLRGDRFEYPADYHPTQTVEGAFGLIAGEATTVRLRFDAAVVRYVRRFRWHPTQKTRKPRGGGGDIEITMQVALTVELTSWILGFGGDVEVLEPEQLRHQVAARLQRALARYQ